MIVFLLLLVAFILTLGLTELIRHYALSRQLIDIPNERSSHGCPTPRGGGLAIVIIFSIATLILCGLGQVPEVHALAMLGAGFAVAAVGFWDDHNHVSRRLRFIVHFAAACWALIWLGGLPPVPVMGQFWDLGLIGDSLTVFAIVWLLNLYNFMDGIDGIASVETITVTGSSALLLWVIDSEFSPIWPLTMMATTAGFLVWNWPPARIFMGDTGSGFIGITLGVMAISSMDTGLNPWCWIILLAIFITDATMTLFRRILRGERWYMAHRSHVYQLLSRRTGHHWPVTVSVGIINAVWLLPLAWLATIFPSISPLIALLAYLPLILAGLWIKDESKMKIS